MIKSFAELSGDQVQLLNEAAFESATIDKVWIGPDEAIKLLGLREAKEEETPHFVYASKRYIMENSRENRPISIPHCVAMAKSLISCWLFCFNGETMIFSESGQALSCQHRLVALWIASLLGWVGKIPVILVRGVPDEFADTVDSGRSRTTSDNFARRPDILPLENLTNWQGDSFGNLAPKVRATLVKDVTTVVNLIRLRTSGHNVHANGKASNGLLHKVYQAFTDDSGKNQLDELVLEAYRTDVGMGSSSTWGRIISRPFVTTALALHSMSGNSPWDYSDGGLVVPDSPKLDTEFYGAKLKELAHGYSDPSEGGSGGQLIADILRASNRRIEEGKVKSTKSGSLNRNYVFAAIVEWLTRPERGDKSYVAKEGGVTNTKYPTFGGVDTGKLSKEDKE